MKANLRISPLEARTKFRIQIKHAVALGPGKADVLQFIDETGSIAEAGRRLGMSYQRAWSLAQAMNRDFLEPLVIMKRGGSAGGGASLSPMGRFVLKTYRQLERRAEKAIEKPLREITTLIRPDAGGDSK